MKPVRPIHDEKLKNYPDVLDRVHQILNGNVCIGGMNTDNTTESPGNLDNKHINVISPGVANTEFAVTHNLNRVPTAAIPVQNSNGGIVYNSGTAWTKTQVFLKCTTVSCGLVLQIY